MKKVFFLLLFFIAIYNAQAQKTHLSYLDVLKEHNTWTDSLLQTMTVREKIAQLMMIAVYSNKDAKHIQANVELISKYKVGGLIFFQGNPIAQAEQTNYYQSQSQIPLLIAMDAEWGVGMRLDSTPSFPFQIALGATQNPQYTYDMAAEIARQFHLLGMHVNFAPVADINNNPTNPVINVRSFGEDKESVSANVIAYTRGLQDGGILACAKHFPGHGSSVLDSHNEAPTLSSTKKELEDIELYPFRQLVDSGIASIMVGHLIVPDLDSSMEIASLSPVITNEVLKKHLGFTGITFTDGMQMKAVTQYYKAPQANMRALLAGNDMLVFPVDILATIDTIEQAILSGAFPMELLDEHCRKVLDTKYFFGLNKGKPLIDLNNLIKNLNNETFQQLKTKIIEKAVTLVTDKNNTIPLKWTDKLKIAYIEVSSGNDDSTFYKTLLQYAPIRKFSVRQNKPQTYTSLLDSLSSYSMVLVGYLEIKQRVPKRNFDMDSSFCRFLLEVAKKNPTVVTLFANPYTIPSLVRLDEYAAVLIANNSTPEYQKATAEAIFGAIPITGKSPVSVPNFINLWQGIERKEVIRLKYGTPRELNITPEHLENVDKIVEKAISEKAFPGCQVLAAHKGVVFYSKNFGYHTYDKKTPVSSTDLYDIASLSKVMGTLPVIMKMYENKDLKLDDPLGKHLKLDRKSNKKKLVVKDLLMHRSGLQSWIPFYVKYLKSTNPAQPVLSPKQDEIHPYFLYYKTYLNRNHLLDTTFFSSAPLPEYNLPVAGGVWAKPSIRKDIYAQMDTSSLQSKQYRYSDLGFYYLQRVIEKDNKITLDKEVERMFYKPLGMQHTSYLPLQKFPKQEIVPTEDELVFRRQLIHGYVHDHGAAIMGGVAGHAGLFSTAGDLAKMLQMLLWKGNYGGNQLLEAATIETFTKYQDKTSRRGLGFDKPEFDPKKTNHVPKESSLSSYGHTGFTGTMIWVDPERELVFIFLSNRIHPDNNNNLITTTHVRSNILREFLLSIDGKIKN